MSESEYRERMAHDQEHLLSVVAIVNQTKRMKLDETQSQPLCGQRKSLSTLDKENLPKNVDMSLLANL